MGLHVLSENRFPSAAAALAVLEGREKTRIQQEQEMGTAFFSFSPETKLQGRELSCCIRRTVPFGDITQCFLLKRLKDYRFMENEVELMGDFYYASCRGRTCTIPQECHCVVKKHLHIHAPLYNQRRMEEYLKWKKGRANCEPQATGKERMAGWFAKMRTWLLPLVKLMAGLLLSLVFVRETQGSLQGFVAINGRHYPRYTYVAGDGRIFEQVNTRASLEEAVPHAGVAGLLRHQCPKTVTVKYNIMCPEQSSCIYL